MTLLRTPSTSEGNLRRSRLMATNENSLVDDLLERYRRAAAAGDVGAAMHALRAAEKLEPNNVGVLLLLSMLHFEQNDLMNARLPLQRVIAIDPSVSVAHYWLGKIDLRQGDFKSAVVSIQQAIRTKPSAMRLVRLGDAFLGLGNRQSAEQAYRGAIALEPDFDEALCALAALIRTTRPEESDELVSLHN